MMVLFEPNIFCTQYRKIDAVLDGLDVTEHPIKIVLVLGVVDKHLTDGKRMPPVRIRALLGFKLGVLTPK